MSAIVKRVMGPAQFPIPALLNYWMNKALEVMKNE